MTHEAKTRQTRDEAQADYVIDSMRRENAELRLRLEEAEDTLEAIRRGDVDALVVGEDIYTLDSASAAYNRLRNDVLAQMEDAVLAFDLDDHIIFMNPAAERQYLSSASDTLGRSRFELYQESWPEDGNEAQSRRSMSASGSYRAHSVHTRKDGTTLHVEATVSQLRDADGQPVGYLSVIRDISERIQAEVTLSAATVALARRERQFSTLVENSPDIIARLDRQSRYIYLSPAIERYTGLRPEEYIGKTPDDLGMPRSYCRVWNEALREVLSTGEIRRIKFEMAALNQEVRVFDARLVAELSEDEAVESVLCISSDVTEQERSIAALRESEARLQFTLDSAQVGDWDLDLETGLATHSLRHDRCFGYTEPVHPWSLEVMLAHVHPDDRPRVEKSFRRSRDSGEDWHFECRVIWPDGTLHWIEAHASILHEAGKPQRMLGIVVDSTSRKQAEEALRDADRRKDEFLATLAHELRNPLAPIRNALQIMRLSREGEVQENARTIIERQLSQMVHLVDDLMDVSRISRGKVELRKELVDVSVAIQAAIETSRPLIDSCRHSVNVSLPPEGELMVNADVTRLTQIIANLLNNAAKYTTDGGSIDIAAVADGNDAVISVQDSGIGIPPKMLPRVFDMFAKVDRNLERSQGGLGIGLALVKRLVEMHGGRVEAHSDGQGRGCRFTVRLPRVAGGQQRAGAGVEMYPLQRETAAEYRILVVDDNLDSADSLAQVLQLLGYETAVVNDGLEAVRLARSWSPRVAILDIGLPGISGHEAARRIRQLPEGEKILMIALSGWGQGEDRRKSKHAGFDHHFVKPLDIARLNKLLARFRDTC